MATATSNLVHDNSSLANFKAWAQFISNAFSTFGWTQTGDTGQVNWSTIASVPSNAYVYEIWNMADALQASCPVFVRVEYGYNSTTVRLRVSVGQGSDGSGNLTGAVTNISQNGLATNKGTATYACYASGDSGSIRFLMWQSGSATTGFLFGVERSKDASGANTAGYVTHLAGDANYGNAGQYWNFQSLVAGNPNPGPNYCTGTTGGMTCTLNVWNVTGNFNGTTAALPVIPLVGTPGNPLLDWCACAAQDVTEGATAITVSIYGSNHNYVSTKQQVFGRAGLGANGTQGILMRYE